MILKYPIRAAQTTNDMMRLERKGRNYSEIQQNLSQMIFYIAV